MIKLFTILRYSILAVICISYMGLAHSATEIEIANERTIKGKKHIYTIIGIFQGTNSRYTFHTDDSSGISSGTYLISHDGGKSAYFVNTEDNTCHQWTNQEFVEMLGEFLLKTTNKFNVKVTEPVIIKELEQQGDEFLGLPTTHIRIKVNFTTSYKFLFFDDTLKVERLINTWLTPQIEGVDTQPLLQRSWQTTGFKEVDRALSGLSRSLSGYRLRSDIVQTMTNTKGKQSSTHITQYIKSIKELDKLPDNSFKIPACNKIDSYEMKKQVKQLLMVLAGKPL